MASKKKRAPRKPRSIETLTAILHAKGGVMRDRRARRPKDARHTFQREEW